MNHNNTRKEVSINALALTFKRVLVGNTANSYCICLLTHRILRYDC